MFPQATVDRLIIWISVVGAVMVFAAIQNPEYLTAFAPNNDGNYTSGGSSSSEPCFNDGKDHDGDGICGDDDNCFDVANPDQINSDGDKFGDACDNCKNKTNSDQANEDNDEWGNACDVCNNNDYDKDGYLNGEDNCPQVSNSTQKNFDGDAEGDICDEDADGDGCKNPDIQTTTEKLNPDGTKSACFKTAPKGPNEDKTILTPSLDLDGDGIGADCDKQTCGNGKREGPEQCDPGYRCGGITCEPGGLSYSCGGSGATECSLEAFGGCGTDCKCTYGMKDGKCIEPICGNNKKEGKEVCDGQENCTSECKCKEGHKWSSTFKKCVVDACQSQPKKCIGGMGCGGDGCCQEGYKLTGNFCYPECGDSIIKGSEQCDQGPNGGNGCTKSCSCESGMKPDGKGGCEFKCGNGKLDSGEECDGGDNCDGPGSGAQSCKCKKGENKNDVYIPDGKKPPEAPGCKQKPFCGNRTIEGTEKCDNGNTPPNINGLGNGKGHGCSDNCILAKCGDGIYQPSGPNDVEERVKEDGEGLKKGQRLGDDEECDLGEKNCDGPGCKCSKKCDKIPICGDGVKDPIEECDYKLTPNSCTKPKFPHKGCTLAVCGDGILTPNGKDGKSGTSDDEKCDEGSKNGTPGSKCPKTCTTGKCGDGIALNSPGEECDSAGGKACGGTQECPGEVTICLATLKEEKCSPCSADCRCKEGYKSQGGFCKTVCGDGKVAGLEKCDKKNDLNCSQYCLCKPGYTSKSGKCEKAPDCPKTEAEYCDTGGTDPCQTSLGGTCSKADTKVGGKCYTCVAPKCDGKPTCTTDGAKGEQNGNSYCGSQSPAQDCKPTTAVNNNGTCYNCANKMACTLNLCAKNNGGCGDKKCKTKEYQENGKCVVECEALCKPGEEKDCSNGWGNGNVQCCGQTGQWYCPDYGERCFTHCPATCDKINCKGLGSSFDVNKGCRFADDATCTIMCARKGGGETPAGPGAPPPAKVSANAPSNFQAPPNQSFAVTAPPPAVNQADEFAEGDNGGIPNEAENADMDGPPASFADLFPRAPAQPTNDLSGWFEEPEDPNDLSGWFVEPSKVAGDNGSPAAPTASPSEPTKSPLIPVIPQCIASCSLGEIFGKESAPEETCEYCPLGKYFQS